MDIFSNLSNLYRGRYSRSDYLVTNLIVIVPLYLVGLFSPKEIGKGDFDSFTVAYLIIYILLFVLFLFVNSFSIVKRFHDLNMSGTNYWFCIIPLVNIYFGFLLLFSKGTFGINKYGNSKIKDESNMIKCEHCKDEVELDEKEILNKSFICPNCQASNNFL